MLTLCSRCRTPHDRRTAAGAAFLVDEAVRCEACREGSSAGAGTAAVPQVVTVAPTSWPLTVLPVAS